MQTTDKREALGLAAAAIGNVIFGFSFIFSKMALAVVSPFVLLSCRFLLSFLIMSALLLTGKFKVSLKGKPWGRVLLLGVFQPVLYFIGENYGLMYTSATFSAVMIALVPIAALFFAAIFLKEKVSAMQIAFCALSILGVIVLSIKGGAGESRLIGVFLLLLAVLTAVFFNLLSRSLSAQFSAFERTYMMFFVGSVFFVPAALIENKFDLSVFAKALSHPQFTWAVLYLSVASSIIAFLLINYANGALPVSRTSVFSNLITVISVIAGTVFLHEPITLISGAAIIMILIGIWGVQKSFVKQ